MTIKDKMHELGLKSQEKLLDWNYARVLNVIEDEARKGKLNCFYEVNEELCYRLRLKLTKDGFQVTKIHGSLIKVNW